MGKDDGFRKHPVDQVSRIMHAQHAMKHFLGALGKPAMPALPVHGAAGPARMKPSHGAPRANSNNAVVAEPRVHMPHTNFTLQIRDSRVDVSCSVCDCRQCSASVQYIHMPTMAKPWIPICAACHAAHHK